MPNLSQLKRQRMLEFLNKIKAEHTDDESLIAINEIETEITEKKYGLVWEEHEERVDVEMLTKVPVFSEQTEKEITADETLPYNFLLEGDNLHSLKLLEKTHKGKIDVIYIDPPYNTGKKDFRYNDTFVEQEDNFRHSKWMSFIHKRMEISKSLLRENGIIFVSIDDNEFSAMKLLLDDIYGEDNRVATLVWKKRYQGAKEKHIVVCHEYLLMYCKDKSLLPTLFVPSDEEYAKKYFKQSDEYGLYRTQPLEAGKSMDDRENLRFPITAPDGSEILPKRQWIWSKEHVEQGIEKHIIGFSQNKQGEWNVFIKQYLNDESGEQRKTKQFSIIDGIYTQHGTKEIESIFGDGNVFKFPKPTNLICKVLDIVPFERNFTVLDFFAGSGTTAHAVMNYNSTHKDCNSRFILCTNNENGICEDITYQRIKTVITGKRKDGSDYSDGISANLKYYKTDFIDKARDDEEYSVSDELLKHIAEMVQLEYAVKLDGTNYILAMSDEEADTIIADKEKLNTCKALYISAAVLLTAEQQEELTNREIAVYVIPDYYFESELLEVGER